MDDFASRPVGRFQVAAHLDSGGMADVFLAHHLDSPGSRGLAVIKVLRERFRSEPEILAMFRDEARTMTRLSHPNVVQVYEHGEADDRPYIAMEYLPGDHLGVLGRVASRRGEALAASLVTRICVQVANALDYLHRVVDERGQPLKLVHRDISPQNIFVTYDGRVKILDFGIALTEDRQAATRTGVLKGKLRYMSPEQIQARPLDGRSDLFSLGVVMWELLCGRRLFEADSEYSIMKRICEEPVPSALEIRPDLPPALGEIVSRLLRRPVEQRQADAAELRGELMAALRDEMAASHPDEIARSVDRLLGERKRRKQAAIESLQASHDLQAYLFGDLNREEESAGSRPRERPAVGGPPGRLQPDAPAPAASAAPPAGPIHQAEPTSASGGPPAAGERPQTRRPAWLALVGIAGLVLVAAAAIAWLAWPSAPAATAAPGSGVPARPAPTTDPTAPAAPPAPAAVADRPAAPPAPAPADPQPAAAAARPAEPAGSATDGGGPSDQAAAVDTAPRAAEVATSPGPEDAEDPGDDEESRKADMGFLMVKTTPVTQAYLGDRYLGKTPLTEVELYPGHYQLILRNEAEHIELTVPVTIRKGEVSSVQYIF